MYWPGCQNCGVAARRALDAPVGVVVACCPDERRQVGRRMGWKEMRALRSSRYAPLPFGDDCPRPRSNHPRYHYHGQHCCQWRHATTTTCGFFLVVAAVVCGEADAYIHGGGFYEWDTAAPVAVARAAGLHASRIDGSALAYNQVDLLMPDILVCRPALAGSLLQAIREVTHAS